MKRQLIKDAWLSYRNGVLPRNASATQLIETRRAFYAGSEALLTSIMCALGPGGDVTEQDLTIMQDIQDELKEFLEQVKAGIS